MPRGVTVEMSQEGRRVEKMMKGQEVNAEKSTHCFYIRCTWWCLNAAFVSGACYMKAVLQYFLFFVNSEQNWNWRQENAVNLNLCVIKWEKRTAAYYLTT